MVIFSLTTTHLRFYMDILNAEKPQTAKALNFSNNREEPLNYRRKLAHRIKERIQTGVGYPD
jgi:hypothetical protein